MIYLDKKNDDFTGEVRLIAGPSLGVEPLFACLLLVLVYIFFVCLDFVCF